MHAPCALSHKHTHTHAHMYTQRRKESSVAEARLAGRAIRFVRRETSRRTRRRKRDGGGEGREGRRLQGGDGDGGGGTRERARRDAGGRGTAEENAEVEVEEDNIDPLVAPPLLAQPTPSLYYPPSLRPSDICAHLRPRNPRDSLVHPRIALPRRYLFIPLTERKKTASVYCIFGIIWNNRRRAYSIFS